MDELLNSLVAWKDGQLVPLSSAISLETRVALASHQQYIELHRQQAQLQNQHHQLQQQHHQLQQHHFHLQQQQFQLQQQYFMPPQQYITQQQYTPSLQWQPPIIAPHVVNHPRINPEWETRFVFDPIKYAAFHPDFEQAEAVEVADSGKDDSIEQEVGRKEANDRIAGKKAARKLRKLSKRAKKDIR